MAVMPHADVAATSAIARRIETARPLDLISLHVPQVIGTSLKDVLVRHYGRRRIALDYAIFLEAGAPATPAASPPPPVAALHGHFPAARYAAIPARCRVVFLRDPVRRTISHYFHWLSQPRHGNPLHERVLDEKLGLIDFARLPQIRWFYSRTIFGGCDMTEFDLVGVVEDLERDWCRFRSLTGIDAPLPHLNRNRYPGYQRMAAKVLSEPLLMQTLCRLLDDDIGFHDRFL